MHSPAGSVLRARCRRCGHWRHPKEFVHNAEVGYCWHCYEWHWHAQRVIAGESPRGCQECDRTHEALEQLTGSPDVKYAMHVKDGIYQLLGVACGCDEAYTRKRADLYRGTPHGAKRGLF